MSNMRVLVTGASGFIGRHCVQALLHAGYEVHGVSRTSAPSIIPGVHWHHADILQPSAVTKLLEECRPTHLIHSAWSVADASYWTSMDNLTWAVRSTDLLQAAQRHGVQRVLGIGTCAEYGVDHDLCHERSTPMRPAGVYAQAKYATQILFDAAANTLRLSTAWARLFFPYGPFDHPNKLVPYTITQLLKGEPAHFSSGTQMRDLLFASDVGSAIVSVLRSRLTGPVNIASGVGLTVGDVVLRIGELMGRPDLIRRGVRQLGALEANRWVASVDRLTHETGWRATTPLDEGLLATIAAFRDASTYPPGSREPLI